MKSTFFFRAVSLILIFGQMSLATHDSNLCYTDDHKNENIYPTCYAKDDGYFLLCRGGIHDKWEYGSKAVRVLTLCEWPDDHLDPRTLLRKFPLLRKLTVSKSNLTEITTVFPNWAQHLEKIEITNTRLRRVPKNCFSDLPSLRSLDLRNSSLDFGELKPEDFDAPSLQTVHFGNSLNCDVSTSWILDSENGSLASKIVDKQRLQCSHPFEGRPLVPVLEVIVELQKECKKTECDCKLVYVVGRAGRQTQRQLMAFATMNCSYRGLTEMPPFLPANISALHLAGNKIADLSPLKTNSFYKRVLDLYLEDNLIETVAILDGIYWLEHFRLLSLRGNRLTDLPTYALENVLPHSANAASLYLGNNPWRCDCLGTPGFQEMLIRYPNLVKDVNDVRCSSVDQDKNSNKQIRDLSRTEICVPLDENYWIHPVDAFNIFLASLIVLILGKLLYDYRLYKKSGKLPWIVTKMP